MDDSDKRILVVDDDPMTLQIIERLLKKHGYACSTASNAKEARTRLQEQGFGLVFSDVNMPGESGLNLARHILSKFPGTAVIMVTAIDDMKLAEAAIEIGAYGYITKPFKQSELLIGVVNALRRHHLELAQLTYQTELEKQVAERTSQLSDTVNRLEEAEKQILFSREETILRLATAAEFGSGETARHVHRVGHYCALMAQKAGFDGDEQELIRLASTMHDVGKIGIPDAILFKPGKLTAKEYEAVQRHAEIGYRILTGSSSRLLQLASLIAWSHHEHVDGRGYPRGLAGDKIPLEGRIAAVAEVFDALVSKRVYRPAFPLKQAFDILEAGRGSQFDAGVLKHFLGARKDVIRIKERFADRG